MDKYKAIEILKYFEGRVKEDDIITDNSTGEEFTLKQLRDNVNPQ